jgi:hypothetical protein
MTTYNSYNSDPRRAQFMCNKGLMCPAPYQPCVFPNATRIESQQFILLIKEVWPDLVLKERRII